MPTSAERATATFDDLARLREAGRAVELIAGEIVEKAAPTPAHGRAELRFGEALHGYNRRAGEPHGPGGWWLMTEVEVLYEKSQEVFRHDVLGFRRDRHAACPSETPVRARPDWVCEILSPSTARYDVVQKQRTLHAHSVAHYWILDPEHATLTVLRHSELAYLRVLDAGVGERVRAEPFDAIEISVSSLLGRDDD